MKPASWLLSIRVAARLSALNTNHLWACSGRAAAPSSEPFIPEGASIHRVPQRAAEGITPVRQLAAVWRARHQRAHPKIVASIAICRGDLGRMACKRRKELGRASCALLRPFVAIITATRPPALCGARSRPRHGLQRKAIAQLSQMTACLALTARWSPLAPQEIIDIRSVTYAALRGRRKNVCRKIKKTFTPFRRRVLSPQGSRRSGEKP